jgi:hypothetical protein
MSTTKDRTLDDKAIDKLKVADVNAVLLAECKKLRAQLTPDLALKILSKSLDDRIQSLEKNRHAPLPLESMHVMAW